MTALLTEFGPWLAAITTAVIAVIGIHVRAKAKGKSEARQEVAAKTNEQAAQAAKVVNDVRSENAALPPGAAADLLRKRWSVRK